MSAGVKRLMAHADLLAALGIVLVVVMMIVPLPPFVIDLFITLNISAAIAIVVATLYVPRALDFAAFPSLLLLTTMLRLGINVSVTRQILLHGEGGEVVHAFGSFVVGGLNAEGVMGPGIALLSFVFIAGVSALELLVCAIQAYVFALLTSLYINDAVNLH